MCVRSAMDIHIRVSHVTTVSFNICKSTVVINVGVTMSNMNGWMVKAFSQNRLLGKHT